MTHSPSLIKSLLFGLTALLLFSCGVNEEFPVEPSTGSWLFELDLKKANLPFEVELKKENEGYSLSIFNAEEEIEVEEVSFRNDSLIIILPVFESAFYLKVLSADSMIGNWTNYYKGSDYKIAVSAIRTERQRFESKKESTAAVFSKYEVTFSPAKEGEYKAIGLFEQEGSRINGTFATETGDYRFLEGSIIGDSLFLSTFDGSHAFYFDALIKDSTMEGRFLSGIHFEENFSAKVNADFELRDPDSLTFSSDSGSVNFELVDADQNKVSLNDAQFQSKVKLIQIMGSWCPNCLDESLYFKELKSKYEDQGLEIIAVAFERTKNKERAFKNINRLKIQKELNYPILLGGFDKDHHPTDIFPMLNHIMSYPTTLFLDKDNKIRKIHTGFYGPGTGRLYEDYKSETEGFIDELLSEG